MDIRSLPKVLLHDHLDGGLRPSTVVELADEYDYRNLPTHEVAELATWFNRGAKRNDLVLYLETFAHTVGVMQHRDAIERVAHECAVDLAADGVVYAEVRMAPELCTEQGLTLDEVVRAMLDGFRSGSAGTGLTVRLICSAMRFSLRRVRTNSSICFAGSFEESICTSSWTLLCASFALASRRSKNLSSLPRSFLRESMMARS